MLFLEVKSWLAFGIDQFTRWKVISKKYTEFNSNETLSNDANPVSIGQAV